MRTSLIGSCVRSQINPPNIAFTKFAHTRIYRKGAIWIKRTVWIIIELLCIQAGVHSIWRGRQKSKKWFLVPVCCTERFRFVIAMCVFVYRHTRKSLTEKVYDQCCFWTTVRHCNKSFIKSTFLSRIFIYSNCVWTEDSPLLKKSLCKYLRLKMLWVVILSNMEYAEASNIRQGHHYSTVLFQFDVGSNTNVWQNLCTFRGWQNDVSQFIVTNTVYDTYHYL